MSKKRICKKTSHKLWGEKRVKSFQNPYFNCLTILFSFVILTVLILWLNNESSITGFFLFQTSNESNFDEGTYNNTFYNSTENFIQLNLYNQSGSYTSKVFDAGSLSSWNNLTWSEVLLSEEKIFVVDNNADLWISNNSEDWILLKDDYTGSYTNGATYMVFNSSNGFFIIFNQDIWSSIDFGYTWTKVNDDYNGGEGQNAKVGIFDISNNLYIIEGDEDVWKSIDSGTTWSKIATNFNGGNGNVEGIVINSSNTFIVVDTAADVWYSLDGESWTLLKDDYNNNEPNNQDYMIIDDNNNLFIIESDDDIWKSTDSGITWEKINDDYNGEAQHIKVAIVDSNNNLYIIEGDEDVWKSTDSGTTWNKIATNFNGGNGNVEGIAITNVTTDLQFQVRSDDDNSSWSNFIGPDGTSNTYYINAIETLNVTNNRYFQYVVNFYSDDGILSPKLFDVSIGYDFIDIIPPGLVTNLNESLTSTDWIYWNWTNPLDSDFSHVEVWLDGVFKVNTTNNFYNATGLNSNTTYEIQIRTSDTSGNVNTTWVNDTAITDEIVIVPPQVFALIPIVNSIFYVSNIIEISANVTDDINVSIVVTNITYPNGTINQLILNLIDSDKYNNSFTVPSLTGIYNITFIANDTNNNINSTEKTNFIVQNTPSGESSVSVSGGGSSGTTTTIEEENEGEKFSIKPSTLEVSLKQGETKKETITIKNIGDEEPDFSVDLEDLKDFIISPTGLSLQNFELQLGEEKPIQLTFLIEKDKKPDLYIKNIIITGYSTKKTIKTIINVESLQALFDIKIEILPEYLEIAPGKDLLAQLSIFNVGNIKTVDVDVIYTLMDMNGNTILEEKEVLAIETKVTFIKRLRIPPNLEEGNYNLYVRTEYDNSIGSANAVFSVSKKYIEKPLKKVEFYIVLILFIIIIFGVVFYLDYKKYKQIKKVIKKITENDLKEKGLIKKGGKK